MVLGPIWRPNLIYLWETNRLIYNWNSVIWCDVTKTNVFECDGHSYAWKIPNGKMYLKMKLNQLSNSVVEVPWFGEPWVVHVLVLCTGSLVRWMQKTVDILDNRLIATFDLFTTNKDKTVFCFIFNQKFVT